MKKLYINGKIYVDKEHFEESMLISDGIIVALGTNEELIKHEVDEVVDLLGKTMLPGLNDSHLHLTMMGDYMNTCNLTSAKSIDQVVGLGKKFLAEHTDTKVLIGKGWNQNSFQDGERRFINRHDLDRISTDIPIVFDRVCIHVSVGNTKALEILNIDETTKIEGGEIQLGADGKPNGIFNEGAVKLIQSVIPSKSAEDISRDFIRAMDYAVSVGLTSVQSCDVMSKDFEKVFNAIDNIVKENKLKLRYSHQFNFQDVYDFKAYLRSEHLYGVYDEKMYSKGALKLFKDGSLGARTALMSTGYNDAPDETGVDALDDDRLYELCKLAHENNIRVLIHAIGDKAIQSVIDVYEKLIDDKENTLRHGIVHNQITTKAQLEKIAELGLTVMYQPIFLLSDIAIINDRVGDELEKTSYAFNSLYQMGAPVSLSTDAPVEDCNPFENIYVAVNRMRFDFTPEGGYFKDECMSVSDAIDAYTIKSAYLEGKEDFKGRLKPGFIADMVILDRDIFTIDKTEIKDIKVVETIVGGNSVYKSSCAK